MRSIGYQPTDSTAIDVGVAGVSGATLAIERVEGTGGQPRSIGSTTVRASESLKSASIVYANVSPTTLQNQGYFGLGSALHDVPDVDDGNGLTVANKGAHQEFSIRGIGQSETVTLLDGHHAHQLNGTYDFSNAPTFGLRNTQVIYGSGSSGFYSVDAIGGVIDMQTLDPTVRPSLSFSQSYGTYNELATTLQATGTLPKGVLNFKGSFGYALALGIDGDAGQYRNSTAYSPFAAFDASAPAGSPSHDLGYTSVATGNLSRGSLFKLRYNVNDETRITGDILTSVASSDQGGTYPTYVTQKQALATGNQLLAFKSPSDACPAGAFTATNFAGFPNGFDQNGVPDGGVTCQTPQQYANFNTGLQLFGQSSQVLRDTDYHLRLESATPQNAVVVDGYTNTSAQHIVSPGLSWIPAATAIQQDLTGADTGIEVTDDHFWRNNEVGAGYSYYHSAELFNSMGAYQISLPGFAREFSYFFRDVYHPPASPLTVYLYDWIKRSSLSETTYNDPRTAIVYQRARDVVRAAFGGVATQPPLGAANSPFVPYTVPSFSAGVACGVPNLIGAAPGNLKPERAVDEELSYGHRWSGDSLVQVSAYNELVRQKFFFTTETLAGSGTAGIPAALLQQFAAAYTAKCGATPNILDFLSTYGLFNIGRVQASGIDIQGRQRFSKRLSLDYSYDVQSTKLLGATPTFLQSDLAIIPGAQLPAIPLHTASLGLNFEQGNGLNAHLTGHYVSANNSRNAPPYAIFNANFGVPMGHGSLNIAVQNLFNLSGTSAIAECSGVPLALNQYATPVDYTPCLGPTSNGALGAGWLTGAGGRRLIVTLSQRVR